MSADSILSALAPSTASMTDGEVVFAFRVEMTKDEQPLVFVALLREMIARRLSSE